MQSASPFWYICVTVDVVVVPHTQMASSLRDHCCLRWHLRSTDGAASSTPYSEMVDHLVTRYREGKDETSLTWRVDLLGWHDCFLASYFMFLAHRRLSRHRWCISPRRVLQHLASVGLKWQIGICDLYADADLTRTIMAALVLGGVHPILDGDGLPQTERSSPAQTAAGGPTRAGLLHSCRVGCGIKSFLDAFEFLPLSRCVGRSFDWFGTDCVT